MNHGAGTPSAVPPLTRQAGPGMTEPYLGDSATQPVRIWCEVSHRTQDVARWEGAVVSPAAAPISERRLPRDAGKASRRCVVAADGVTRHVGIAREKMGGPPPRQTITRLPDHHRVEFTATDLESAQAYLTAAYGAPVRLGSEDDSYRLRHVRRGPGPFHLDTVDHTATAECHCRPVPVIACVRMQRGVRTDLDRDDHLGPGDLAISGQPGEMVRLRYASARFTTVLVPLQAAVGATRNRPDDAPVPLRFTARRPARPADARRWLQTVDYITRSLLDHPEIMAQPLLCGAATRLLAVTMLTTFPNTWITEPGTEDRRDAHPGTLRRAMAFIEANPDLDIGTVDIARAAYVTTRAMQLAFRRHLDTTPMAYLRRVRLDRAHDDLKRATPDDGVTVTAVASRWGFASPSRFTAYYYQAYGILPSRTLRD